MTQVRVLVVDDSAVARRLISDALSRCPGIEVAGTAADGSIALARIEELSPNAVVLDVEMPGMDGFRTLERIRAVRPTLPVILFSSLTEHGAMATFDALDHGASDYVAKPSALRGETLAGVVGTLLAPKLRALVATGATSYPPAARTTTAPPSVRATSLPPALRATSLPPALRATSLPPATPSPLAPRPSLPVRAGLRTPPRIVVIAASTGGPNALAEFLPALPAHFPLPIVLVQHMPPVFTRCLAERLDPRCGLRVLESQGEEPLRPGTIWIAQGGRHIEVARAGTDFVTRLTDALPENSCRPAADVLFRSAARVFGPSVIAVVMTGMGQDGLLGAGEIVTAGGRVLVQDRASCTVWGMPRAVEQAGLADLVVPLRELASVLTSQVTAGSLALRAAYAGRA